LGLSATVVRKRLYRMRAKFHAKLAALGMLALLLVLFALPSRVGDVATPPPETTPAQPVPPAFRVPAWDGGACHVAGDAGTAPCQKNRNCPREEIAPSTPK
jgi:hypothetical protein